MAKHAWEPETDEHPILESVRKMKYIFAGYGFEEEQVNNLLKYENNVKHSW